MTATLAEPPFPGFHAFQQVVSEVEFMPDGWRSVLKASKGVYLMICPDTGAQYVGSAVGPDGFYGRWLEYARDGNGGNALLKDRDARKFLVSILEVAPSSATLDETEILSREAVWKRKLGSRVHGLNAN
ncbi:MAG: GIY-YIG nuclease family protein [Alphaproteobacteria bacterium]